MHQSYQLQTAVVSLSNVANTVGSGAQLRRFAVDLFNKWGIGTAAANHGLLILHVKGRRQIEIVTGRSTEHLLTTSFLKRTVEQQCLHPSFRNGECGTGTVKALEAIERELQRQLNRGKLTGALQGKERLFGPLPPGTGAPQRYGGGSGGPPNPWRKWLPWASGAGAGAFASLWKADEEGWLEEIKGWRMFSGSNEGSDYWDIGDIDFGGGDYSFDGGGGGGATDGGGISFTY